MQVYAACLLFNLDTEFNIARQLAVLFQQGVDCKEPADDRALIISYPTTIEFPISQ